MGKKTPLSQKLAVLANLRGFSQAKLAQKVGVQASHLNHYLKGHGDVRSDLFLRLMSELDFDVEEMVNRELARLSGMSLKEKSSPSGSMDAMIKALAPEDRRALVGYISKFMKTNLGSPAAPHLRALKEWA